MGSQTRQRRVRFNLPERKSPLEHGTVSYRNGTLIDSRLRSALPGNVASAGNRPEGRFESKYITDLDRHVAPEKTVLEKLRKNHFVIIDDAPRRIFRAQEMTEGEKICKNFFRIRLFDEVFRRTRSLSAEEEQKLRQQSVLAASTEKPNPRNLYDPNNARIIIADLVQRWHKIRYKEHPSEQTRYVTRLTAAPEDRRKTTSRTEMAPGTIVRKLLPPVQIVDRRRKLLSSAPTSPTRLPAPAPIKSASVLTSVPVTITAAPPSRLVSFRSRLKSDVKRFACVKMTLEQEQPVTTLLRAARESDEELLTVVLKKILVDGISKEALNSTDKSGRDTNGLDSRLNAYPILDSHKTAISYICSSNLTNFLDILLQIPGIDVNKPDNEGNTPLHFAAQAGQAEILNMLITRSRSLQVDTKNNLGFTPLMKAALQGRTRCAKLLLFAGASPLATDSGRGLRAEQWARFCGRESCAEMIEKCARARLLEKSPTCRSVLDSQSKNTIVRSKTYGDASEGLRSKFRKVFPFNFSLKEKSHKSKDSSASNLVSYLTSATICASGPALPSQGKSQVMSTLLRPLEVPKLEVTPANNANLIKKYESRLSRSESKKSITSPR